MSFNNFFENQVNDPLVRQKRPRIKVEHSQAENRFDRPEDFLEILKPELKAIQSEVNGEYGKILDENAAIRMEGRHAAIDTEQANDKEAIFADEEGKTLDQWRADREKDPGIIAEMAVVTALHSRLKEDFIIARASKWDDYENGVDYVLIDKENGAMVCGVDLVIGSLNGTGAIRKDNKITEKMQTGGSDIRYGATINNGNLFRKELHEVPTFFLAITRNKLLDLLSEIKDGKKGSAATESLNVLSRLIDSLEEEYINAQTDLKLPVHLKEHLDEFEDSLIRLKENYHDSF